MRTRPIWIFTFSTVLLSLFFAVPISFLFPAPVSRLVFYAVFYWVMDYVTRHAVEWSEEQAQKGGFRWVK